MLYESVFGLLLYPLPVLLGAAEGRADCAELLDGATSPLLEAAELTFLVLLLLSTRLLPEE